MVANMATPFSTQCGVAISNNYDTIGSITRATFSTLSPEQWKALFTDGTLWHEMNAYLRHSFEMRACGIKRNSFYDLLMSSARGIGHLLRKESMDRGPSQIRPFVLARQMSVVNNDFWAITNGFAVGSYTPSVSGPITDVTGDLATGYAVASGARVIRVIAGYGTSYSLPLHERYFLPGHYVYVMGTGDTGEAQLGQWQILDSAIAGDASYVDILVNPLNAIDTAYADAGPTNGLLIVGGNNVNDYESWCRNNLNVNPVKYVPFWFKTSRLVRRTSSFYLETLGRLSDDNAYFKAFGDIPMAERNRQDEERDQKYFVNDFLFGRAINDKQTLDTWGQLPQITSFTGGSIDPDTGGDLISYRANPIGVYDQLKACSRWRDLLGQPYEISTFLETEIYNIVRARKSRGRPATSIDVYTDSTTADEFLTAYVAYATAKITGIQVNLNIKEGETMGFNWQSYKCFKPAGVVVNIIVVDAFDDLINSYNQLPTPLPSRGRFLLVLDIGTGGGVYVGMIDSNRRVWNTGDISNLAKLDATWACVMENPTVRTAATSKTFSVIVECPFDQLWVENFSSITHTP